MLPWIQNQHPKSLLKIEARNTLFGTVRYFKETKFEFANCTKLAQNGVSWNKLSFVGWKLRHSVIRFFLYVEDTWSFPTLFMAIVFDGQLHRSKCVCSERRQKRSWWCCKWWSVARQNQNSKRGRSMNNNFVFVRLEQNSDIRRYNCK